MKRLIVILALCFAPIVAQAQAALEPTFKTLTTVAFGSVGAAYTAFLTNTAPLIDIDILNVTDQPITCAFDTASPAADHVVVPAYSSYSPPLDRRTFYIAKSVYCKRTSSAPTVGSVYITASF